ncbi:hypothetical protein [Acinetobacter baumannii]|uniref:hypothetical protein n=1 Tax=Acinetobacter baumannii TaxID=470 RepID=UPI0012982812|nr:hypothetical protein [Acinetobacter baumannii]
MMYIHLIFFLILTGFFVFFIFQFKETSKNEKQAISNSAVNQASLKEEKRGYGWSSAAIVFMTLFLFIFFTSFNMTAMAVFLAGSMICSQQSYERFQRAKYLSRLEHLNYTSF